jgi:hypothetical protein
VSGGRGRRAPGGGSNGVGLREPCSRPRRGRRISPRTKQVELPSSIGQPPTHEFAARPRGGLPSIVDGRTSTRRPAPQEPGQGTSALLSCPCGHELACPWSAPGWRPRSAVSRFCRRARHRMTVTQTHRSPPWPAPLNVAWPTVRMTMTARLAERLAEHLIDVRGTEREAALCEQLWLRTVFVEQRRRTVMAERAAFDAQADRLLAALDPPPACAPPLGSSHD